MSPTISMIKRLMNLLISHLVWLYLLNISVLAIFKKFVVLYQGALLTLLLFNFNTILVSTLLKNKEMPLRVAVNVQSSFDCFQVKELHLKATHCCSNL